MVATVEQVRAARKPRKINPRRPRKPGIDLEYIRAKPVVMKAWARLHIILVGCGGTGSWLAPSLARLAYVLGEEGRLVSLTFVDPDTVESKNVPRQNFCEAELGRNKASALALRYGAAWSLDIRAIPEPFKPDQLDWPQQGELTLLVGCVDNAKARQQISKGVGERNNRGEGAASMWWLDCGNATDGGQVLLGSAHRAQDLKGALESDSWWVALPSPALQRPELLEALPEEVEASPLSCAEIATRKRQSLMINQSMAAIAAEYALLLVSGTLRMFATYVDMPSGAWKSYYTTPETVAASVGKTPAIFRA